jgi:hypothetical protein
MLGRMPARLFHEWMAYERLEPFGQDWLQTGVIASTVANSQRDPEQQPAPFLPPDFMPAYETAEDEQEVDADALVAYVAMLNAALGGVDLRQKENAPS